jgi:hypothetical protein
MEGTLVGGRSFLARGGRALSGAIVAGSLVGRFGLKPSASIATPLLATGDLAALRAAYAGTDVNRLIALFLPRVKWYGVGAPDPG